MIGVLDSYDHPVTLRFYGGFVHLLPGGSLAQALEVHFRFPAQVSLSPSCARLEAALTSAMRLDFMAREPLTLPERPMGRSLSHVLPVDHHGFRKTIGVKGGAVRRVSDADQLAQKTAELEAILSEDGESVRAFRRFTGTHGHEDEYLKDISDAFFEQVRLGELEVWLDGYHLQVELIPTSVRVNGYLLKGESDEASLPAGVAISFRAAPGSHLPHYPADNPHVLEQPPTL